MLPGWYCCQGQVTAISGGYLTMRGESVISQDLNPLSNTAESAEPGVAGIDVISI